MKMINNYLQNSMKNFLFLGEAGSGKSEIAINLARELSRNSQTGQTVHFFDLDMTKPLFRSRDLSGSLEAMGIVLHYEEQFMDAPTLVGGVRRLLKDPAAYVVMDVGGDYIGARSIGGFAEALKTTGSIAFYVVNAYRPWSDGIEHIDQVLGEILAVSHLTMEQIHIISNPNHGIATNAEEVIAGHLKTEALITPYQKVEFLCVKEALYEQVKQSAQAAIVVPITLYLTYPWLDAAPV